MEYKKLEFVLESNGYTIRRNIGMLSENHLPPLQEEGNLNELRVLRNNDFPNIANLVQLAQYPLFQELSLRAYIVDSFGIIADDVEVSHRSLMKLLQFKIIQFDDKFYERKKEEIDDIVDSSKAEMVRLLNYLLKDHSDLLPPLN